MTEKNEIDKVVEYTKQFIDAATPIAKQAYETGLVTLQIDAVHELVFSAFAIILAVFLLRWVRSEWLRAKAEASKPENKNDIWKRDPSAHMEFDGILHGVAAIMSVILILVGMVFFLNTWTWIKLFSPDLWIAHMAVSKLIGD